EEGLIRYDTRVKKNYTAEFKTLIRQVVVNGNLVFNGNKSKRENASHPKPSVPVIDYKDRNVRFEFAAPFFEAESATQYRYLLEGYDDRWSGWSAETRKDYTNLDFGMYTFRVRARNVYLHESNESVYLFKVLPPWYKTWWALSIDALIIFLLMFFIIKWRSGKLERERQRLERIVNQRTTEINQKNRQLEDQTGQLKEQSEKLKEMAKVKSRFFANISHEFRTPLTLIMGPLEQMLSQSRDTDYLKKYNLMLRNSQRLLGLINQLLELSKFESGKIKLQVSRQNIIPFLRGITNYFDPVAVKNELDLTFHAREENITLYCDPGKLEEVILNILSNAVKFTPPGGKITVTAVKIDAEDENFPAGTLDISICDTGPGIPRDQLAHIFDRFYQSDVTYEHHRKGSGIGLSIAKELVELHHGKINVHSREGKGTEFIIRLPLDKEHLKPDEIVEISAPPIPRKPPPVLPDIPETGSTDTIGNDDTGAAETEKDTNTVKPGKDIVLVVEDSTDVRDYIRGSLEPAYAVVEAGDGQEGIQKARELIPDLIISDIMMPGVDGHELCRQLKNDVKTSHIPIVLLTAKASEENIIEGLETGADDYVTKPFSTTILAARIKNLIDLRRHMQLTLDREMTLKPVKIPVSKIDKAFIKKLRQVIRENISDPDFNIEQLCNKLEMSQPTLYRKIHALTGESPTEFIRSYRLKRGAEMLKNNFGTVLEVAFEVGFSSAAYFTKCFKKKFHQSPTLYKETETGEPGSKAVSP
ncbi:MAG: response regulator, partial [bacterium]|nr:response regulator [bacterium]